MRKEIPILFSTPMVQAVLDDRKNQTRRVIKPQPVLHNDVIKMPIPLDEYTAEMGKWQKMGYKRIGTDGAQAGYLLPECRYGDIESIHWVRETSFLNGDDFIYLADGTCCEQFEQCECEEVGKPKWKPSIHMPKAAARIWNEVTEIRAERIADISEADCIAEGIEPSNPAPLVHRWKDYLNQHNYFESPRDSFRSLWQSINGKPSPNQVTIDGKLLTVCYTVYPFDEEAAKEFDGLTEWKGKPLTVIVNPWVWVVGFKVLSKTGKPLFKKLSDIDA